MRVDSSGNVLIGTTTHHNFSGSTTEVVVGTSGTGTNAGGAVTFGSGSGFLGYIGFQESAGTIGTNTSVPLLFNTGGTERMRIDSSGRVTMPYQPAFCVFNSVNISGAQNPVIFNSVVLNRGGSYSTVTGRFTAPVTGAYYIACTNNANNAGSGDGILQVNGTDFIGVEYDYATSGSWLGLTTGSVFNLSAGDYVTYRTSVTGISVESTIWNRFYGYLIG
jgi:hypothetical protein